ncbi:MAG: tyrosine--tRNA ligase [Acidimicrobiales bacterium]
MSDLDDHQPIGAAATIHGSGAGILADLAARGLIQDSTDLEALTNALVDGSVTVYCGFDPTADSLHLGNLFPLLLLKRFQLMGHRPIALAGGATGMVGDPGGRSSERNLLDAETLDHNLVAVKVQLQSILDFEGVDGAHAAIMVDNRDWTVGVHILDFLRDVGKHVTVNTMLAKESIKARVESENGISFTEFSYMLLQAHDYLQLFRLHQCTLQVGGSDQWGNITAGADLIRRVEGAHVHALTVPLLTQSDGAKFGKSVGGAIWLDPEKTLPYEMHQFLLNRGDDEVEKLLLQLTMLPVDEIGQIMDTHRLQPEQRIAQRRLADAVVTLVHGPESTTKASLAGEAIFGSGELSAEMLASLRGIIPETDVLLSVLGADALLTMAVAAGLASSNSDARKTLAQNGFSVNRVKVASAEVGAEQLLDGKFLLIQKGKKNRHLVIVR